MTRDELLPHLVASLAAVGADLPLQTVMALAEDLAPRLAFVAPERRAWTSWTTGDEERLRALYEVDGMSVAQIAADLNKSVGAVRGTVSRLNLRRPAGHKATGRPARKAR